MHTVVSMCTLYTYIIHTVIDLQKENMERQKSGIDIKYVVKEKQEALQNDSIF